MKEFIYYFNGVMHTETEIEFLRELTKDCEDPDSVINGILESKERYDYELSNL